MIFKCWEKKQKQANSFKKCRFGRWDSEVSRRPIFRVDLCNVQQSSSLAELQIVPKGRNK